MTAKRQKSMIDVVALPGDGIGPEVMKQALSILRLISRGTDIDFNIEIIPCGGRFFLQHGSRDWPLGSEDRCKQADMILLGSVGVHDPQTGAPITMTDGRMAGSSPVLGNRTKLELFANVRPVKLYPGVLHQISGRHKQVWMPGNVDMVIVRENTEDLYAGIGGTMESNGKTSLATDTRIITRHASERVIRFAFELSRERSRGAPADGKKRVTCILKDNILTGCRLFGEVFREVGAEYPDIEQELAIVDAFTQWLMCRPEHYDVCVTTNMFGDILTDLASVLQGGMGLAVGCNMGISHAMFEPIHGSAPNLAGKNVANPMAMILALREGLRWLGKQKDLPILNTASDILDQSVASVLQRGSPLTMDMVGEKDGAPTSAVTEAIAREFTFRLEGL